MSKAASLALRAAAGPDAITVRQKRLALGIAAIADILQVVISPLFAEGVLSPFDDALDAVVALALVLTLGWRWRLLLALGVELIPGMALFPTWTALVATLPTVPEPVRTTATEAPSAAPQLETPGQRE